MAGISSASIPTSPRTSIAYFINQYPKVSHSFIRREIQALENQGLVIFRYALTSTLDELVDDVDKSEFHKSRLLFHQPKAVLLKHAVHGFFSSLRRAARGLALTLKTGWRSDRGLLRHLAYFVEALIIADWCRADGIAHIHAHFGTNSATVAMLVNAITGIPFSFTVHGPEEFDKPGFIGLGLKLGRCAFAVAISSYGRSQLWRWVDAGHWHKVKVVHCGLDDGFHVGAIATAPDCPKFVCVGRLCEQKGQLLLIEALAALRQENIACSLVLAGDGPMRGDIEQAVIAQGLAEQVHITGWISSGQVRREIAEARALVLPSFAEGLPVVIMEAMALKRPVISTYVAGIPELVKDKETGWLVPAGDVAALTDAMREALATPIERLAAMGEQGRQRVLERHDINKEAAKLKRLFVEKDAQVT